MKKYLAIILLFICATSILHAQQNMTLYQMHDIPQSNTLNPAVPISCGWIVGIPVLGSISAAASSPLSYNDLGAGQDTLYANDLISKLHGKNIIATSAAINLITVGYRAEHTFYQFTVNERVSQVSTISKDPFVLLLKGNAGYVGQTVRGEPSVNAIYYREYGFNIAREIDPTFWVGARAKLIFGRLSARSTNNKVGLYTEPGTYNLDLTSDLLVRASVPGTVTIGASGKVAKFETDIQTSDFIFNPTNVGAGLDLGITKDLDNGIKLSASVLNLGFVSWSKNLQTFRQSGTIPFNGPFAPIDELDALIDTVRSFLKLDYSQESYTQMLAPLVMAGGNYPVTDNLRVGVTGMAEFQPNAVLWAATATAFTQNLPVVDLGLSYTVTPYSYFNLGFGVGARLGAFNIHLITDNIIGLFQPFNARYATLQFGMNLRFGCGNGSKSTPGAVPCPAFKSASLARGAVPCSTKANQ